MGEAMKRIMIVGQPGSGKSTFARAVAAGFGLPVVHLDHIHWMPGWQERPLAEKISLISAEEANDTWVIEGGLSATYANRLARAEMLIWLDRDWRLRLFRVLRRSWHYRGRARPDLPDGCVEAFGRVTVEFIGFIWRTRHKNRATLAELARQAQEGGKAVVYLASDRAARSWLETEGLVIPEEWQ